MINTIVSVSKSDDHLAALLAEAGEYAQIYLLAKQRHKGCNGTGELMTLKEELKDIVDKLIQYCREKSYLSGDCTYDADSFAGALVRIPRG